MDRDLVRISKFLSLVLRHRPEAIGLTLDEHGWAEVDELLSRAARNKRKISMETLLRVVNENDKQRFAFNADETRIRASHGHSLSIDLGLEAIGPPELLFHGTATRFLASIQKKGLLRQKRQYVHLSADYETAVKVGQRHGRPAVLVIASADMARDGYRFFLSENHVWLTDHVPPGYISISE